MACFFFSPAAGVGAGLAAKAGAWPAAGWVPAVPAFSAFTFFILTLSDLTFGRPKAEERSFHFSASIKRWIRSCRFRTFRCRVRVGSILKLECCDMTRQDYTRSAEIFPAESGQPIGDGSRENRPPSLPFSLLFTLVREIHLFYRTVPIRYARSELTCIGTCIGTGSRGDTFQETRPSENRYCFCFRTNPSVENREEGSQLTMRQEF